jgi:ribosomal protein L6
MKKRRVSALPPCTRFMPQGCEDAPEVTISLEEYECIRLLDYVGMTQEECARQMGVARTTVQALYLAARKRMAGCLVEGRPLVISGGSFELCPACQHSPHPVRLSMQKGSNSPMKLAVTYDNGQIFQHFGHTEEFKVYTIEDNEIKFTRPDDEPRSRSMHGLYRALIHNMVEGVSKGFEKKQELVGVGYRVEVQGQLLTFALGYSHDIQLLLPAEVKAEAAQVKKGENPVLILRSADKQLLGEVAAKIRSFRKPEPYKGKGIKFVGEQLRRKAGKTAGAK